MTRYEVWLFFHISFVVLWVGAGALFHILGFRADRARDEAAIERVFDDLVALANVFFIPSSLLVVVFGIALTLDGPWSFDQLWIALGLVGFALTFLTGLLWIKPQSERVKALIERDRGMSAEAYAVARRMLVFSRLDYVVLFLVIADMVFKPTGDDVGLLVLMAAVFLAAVALFGWRARSLEVPLVVREAG